MLSLNIKVKLSDESFAGAVLVFGQRNLCSRMLSNRLAIESQICWLDSNQISIRVMRSNNNGPLRHMPRSQLAYD
jgi:hypothetical protein